MLSAPLYPQEDKRIEAAQRLGLLDDSKSNAKFDELTKLAVQKLHVPMSTLTVLDKNREYYKSCQGLDAKDGERAISFCGHALLAKELFIVPDCRKDPRFSDNPMVTGKPYIRFYAGIALSDYMTGMPVAVFCIKDTKSRNLSVKELDIFMSLATRAEELLNNVSEANMTKLVI